MLETILRLYTMAMTYMVHSPLPHIVGPPGCGKSTFAEQAASLLGVNLHIINVARISPLDVEGVQMPHGSGEDMVLRMLPATFWTQLKQGDIVLLDEFLRGFPEVYNALLDILTSRRAGAYVLPKVFIMAASNSVVTYDKALEDRLLHIHVPDPRKSKRERKRLATIVVEALGLLPKMAESAEMQGLLDNEVLPMYRMLDLFKGGGSVAGGNVVEGQSIRKLIGQAQLREFQSVHLTELISMNNMRAMNEGKPQFVVLPNGKASSIPHTYMEKAKGLVGNDRLTEVQKRNLTMNLQLIELEAVRTQKEGSDADDDDDPFLAV